MAKGKARRATKAIENVDKKVAEAAAPLHRTKAVKLIGVLSELGDQPEMRVVCGAAIAAGLARSDRKLVRAGIRMLAAHSLATGIKIIIKRQVDRTRPTLLVEEGRYEMKAGNSREKEQSSFPSGHTAGAVAVAGAFAADYPGRALPAWGGAAAIAAAQVPRCMHYPSDIAAGTVIGLASAALVNRLLPAEADDAEAATRTRGAGDALRTQRTPASRGRSR